MASPTTSPARSARSAPGGQPVSRNWLDRAACSSTWFGSGASLWSNRLPPKAVRRSDTRVQYVDLQFGDGPAMHLRFASAAREFLVMKSTTLRAFFPNHSGSWSSFTGESRQHERRFRTAPAKHRIFVRLAKYLRSMASASKRDMKGDSQSIMRLDLAREGESGKGADRAEVPLQTEQVVSFADVCCAKRSPCGSYPEISRRKPSRTFSNFQKLNFSEMSS